MDYDKEKQITVFGNDRFRLENIGVILYGPSSIMLSSMKGHSRPITIETVRLLRTCQTSLIALSNFVCCFLVR